jgi:cation:H+ antiporter
MVENLIIFIISLGVLLLAAKYFTESAERIGHALKMSPLMIGVVIVALGTSMPELVSAILAASKGNTEIIAGNVLGANISNIFLILGLTTLVAKKTIELGEEYIFIDLHFMLGSAFLLVFFMWDGMLVFWEGILLIAGFLIYQLHLFQSDKPKEMPVMTDEAEIKAARKKGITKEAIIILISSVAIYFGAEYVIHSIVGLAEILEVDEGIISITALSLGTTLPELFVSITATRAGKPQIAVGNILGSCIFNAFAVSGIGAIIAPITVPESLRTTALVFLIIASLFFYLLSQDKKISKWEGLLFILFYVVFLFKLLNVI